MGGKCGGGSDHNDMTHMCEVPSPSKNKKKEIGGGRMKRRKEDLLRYGVESRLALN